MRQKATKTLRSRRWFGDPSNPNLTAMYLSNYLNYGLTLEELHGGRPIVGIAQTGSDLTPCNRHHVELAKRVKDGIRDAGGVPIEFPVHPIQEAGKRPTASLDRNLAYVGLSRSCTAIRSTAWCSTTGCDKTTPACLMAAATVNIPAIVLSGGPKIDGWWKGKLAGSGAVVWESRKLFAEGKIAFDEMVEMISSGEPSIGHCNTMGTALSMNCARGSARHVAARAARRSRPPIATASWMAYETGRRIVAMIDEDLRPSDIMTQRRVRECRRRRRSARRLVELPAAHDRHRPPDGGRPYARGLETGSAPRFRCSSTASRRAGSSAKRSIGPAAFPACCGSCSRPAS